MVCWVNNDVTTFQSKISTVDATLTCCFLLKTFK